VPLPSLWIFINTANKKRRYSWDVSDTPARNQCLWVGPLSSRHSGGRSEGRLASFAVIEPDSERVDCDHKNRILWSQSVTYHDQEGIHPQSVWWPQQIRAPVNMSAREAAEPLFGGYCGNNPPYLIHKTKSTANMPGATNARIIVVDRPGRSLGAGLPLADDTENRSRPTTTRTAKRRLPS